MIGHDVDIIAFHDAPFFYVMLRPKLCLGSEASRCEIIDRVELNEILRLLHSLLINHENTQAC